MTIYVIRENKKIYKGLQNLEEHNFDECSKLEIKRS